MMTQRTQTSSCTLRYKQRFVTSCRPLVTLSSAAPGKTTLGFVGMGILGVPMTLNLLKAGYEVVVYNRNIQKTDPVVAAGAQVATTPRECAQRAQYIFATLSDPQAAISVANGPDGIASGISAGKGYIDISTVDAETSNIIATAIKSTGASFLEAPVSGSKAPAEQGKLIFLTAGDEELFKAVEGPLDVMGKAKYYLGGVGSGANMKLVVNMLNGSMMAALAEAMALADKSGLSQADLLEVLSLGAMANPMFALKGPAVVERSYPPAFPLKHQQKDLRLALALGDSLGQPLPVAAAANEAYKMAKAKGQANSDMAAVYEATQH
ncbi:hypothetical protein CEUSTIGMA_g5085.t1 [Chlamydomonas eustigma]|uniref:6-phosphogluconate dehydrogenase NADP-binding domain-containing protein n=1 Tax=Chlamydomonas eustigma TaxID=1157962 RepID=A0A250X420_9CHLO|nr:hypothetical protein CEUSTIGMA_g5085.t1 [Chlamydomonas eustigma]|eukprot:GAX77642.1 hypothetical protein CEUSTIGMA_g5085.t1 [Chlamydomonas eustigma]